MIRELIFLWKYKILKEPTYLPNNIIPFFKLPLSTQKKVLNSYFKKFQKKEGLEYLFDTPSSRFYDNGYEKTFFDHYFFDKKLLEHQIENIRLIDNFNIKEQEKEDLIQYALKTLKEEKKVDIKELIHYPDELPKSLSEHYEFMKYYIQIDESNIKYITYNINTSSKQKELIKLGIELSKKHQFQLNKFLKNNKELPEILKNNFDFLIYIIKNDINNINYIKEEFLEQLTITNKNTLVASIIESLENNFQYIDTIKNNESLFNILSQDKIFIDNMIKKDIESVYDINWQALPSNTRDEIIDKITTYAIEKNYNIEINKYPFKELFFQNKNFMRYLIEKDIRWITVVRVEEEKEIDHLIEVFLKKKEEQKYHFHLKDFLEDGKYINHRLIENKKMLHYFFKQHIPVVKYINFFDLINANKVISNIMEEMQDEDFTFHNQDFLIDEKYPILLSNHYDFMKYVIDKNFNHLAYIDTSMSSPSEVKRIINYACRMLYYIRGNNKKLNFDIDGYFKNSSILENEYFQECLKSLSNM